MAEMAWECSCGHVEYGNLPPEECPSCFKIDNFTQLPEELIEERERDKAEEEMEMFETPILSNSKSSLKKSKKPKLKKPGRKKRK